MYATRSKSKALKLSDCTNTYGNNATATKKTSLDQKPKVQVKTEMSENLASSSKYFALEAPEPGQALMRMVKSEPAEAYDYEKPVKYEEVAQKHRIKSVGEEEDLESASKKSKWEPPNWRQVFELIRQMRQGQDAPVDTMGCDSLANLDKTLTPKEQRFQVLVSLMLSAQTKDEVTAAATNKLQKLPLTIDSICSAAEETISQLIYPVSFYKRKAQYIKRTAQILKDAYDSDIPNNVTELCKLPGVGPKMAYIAMHVAWKTCAGIGVDTHVHRISNRLGWTKKPTKIPEQTRKELEEWLPQEYWNEVNHMLVGFGQQTCRPIGPKCGICLAKDLCPTGRSFSPKKAAKAKCKTEIKVEDAEN